MANCPCTAIRKSLYGEGAGRLQYIFSVSRCHNFLELLSIRTLPRPTVLTAQSLVIQPTTRLTRSLPTWSPPCFLERRGNQQSLIFPWRCSARLAPPVSTHLIVTLNAFDRRFHSSYAVYGAMSDWKSAFMTWMQTGLSSSLCKRIDRASVGTNKMQYVLGWRQLLLQACSFPRHEY
ncbi:hypothetical protein BDZ97DRAFT_1192610 [Flammula alnicola]|nr:hypothetical protein BDZ97DRAFT_1192610 [Flammula alnicola]